MTREHELDNSDLAQITGAQITPLTDEQLLGDPEKVGQERFLKRLRGWWRKNKDRLETPKGGDYK